MVVEEGRGALTVELPDGTQAIVQNVISQDPQGVTIGKLNQAFLPGSINIISIFCICSIYIFLFQCEDIYQ